MEQITIDIQLDPIKDGIKVPETDVSRPDAHAVILGTNGKIRQISMKEAEHILDSHTTVKDVTANENVSSTVKAQLTTLFIEQLVNLFI